MPSRLGPSDLSWFDGKHLDGATIVPWKNGKCLVWDVTCPDIFTPSYQHIATKNAGAVVADAEQRKIFKYASFDRTDFFVPCAIETSDVFGSEALLFLKVIASAP